MISKETLRELSSYPVTEFKRVTDTDVDDFNYFVSNIGVSIKEILYYDESGHIKKKEIMTYEEILGDAKNVKRIYSFKTENFIGVWALTTLPTSEVKNGFYLVTRDVSIAGTSFKAGEFIGYVDTGYGVYQWKKATLNANNIPIAV